MEFLIINFLYKIINQGFLIYQKIKILKKNFVYLYLVTKWKF